MCGATGRRSRPVNVPFFSHSTRLPAMQLKKSATLLSNLRNRRLFRFSRHEGPTRSLTTPSSAQTHSSQLPRHPPAATPAHGHTASRSARASRRLRALNLQPLTTQPRLWQRDQRLTLLDFNTTSMTKVCASSQRHATWPTGPRPHRRSATLHSRLTAACVPTTECKPASLPLTPRPSPLAPRPSPLVPHPSLLAPPANSRPRPGGRLRPLPPH